MQIPQYVQQGTVQITVIHCGDRVCVVCVCVCVRARACAVIYSKYTVIYCL